MLSQFDLDNTKRLELTQQEVVIARSASDVPAHRSAVLRHAGVAISAFFQNSTRASLANALPATNFGCSQIVSKGNLLSQKYLQL
jgi:thymidine kinase